MKRIIFYIVIAGLFACQASGQTWTFTQAELLTLDDISYTDGISSFAITPSAVGANFSGTLKDLGDVDLNAAVTYGTPGTFTLPDLTPYKYYQLQVDNTNNSYWSARIFVEDSGGRFYSDAGSFVEIQNTFSHNFALDLVAAAGSGLNLSDIQDIGLEIQGYMVGNEFLPDGITPNPNYNQDYPSNPDVYHLTINPVPVPGGLVLGLLGLGVAATKLRRKKGD